MEISDSTQILIVRMVLFMTYVFVGAAIFQVIEGPYQVHEMQHFQNIRRSILKKYNITENDTKRLFKTFPSTSLGNGDFLEWNYGNAFLFAMVVLTTIGYGNIVPKTVPGRIFCIIYALIGIPGTCLTLKAVGDKISEQLGKLITYLEKRVLKNQHPRRVELKVAITTISFTIFFLLPLCALIVKVRHQQWTYLECFYFTFTTLSTIGFGDYLPRFKNNVDYVLILSAFVGLAFVSSIFCSMHNVLEQYGVSVRIVRSLKEKSSRKTSASSSDGNVKSRCEKNGVQEAGIEDTNGLVTESVKRNLDIIGEDIALEERSLNSIGDRNENRKRGSTISLGVFRC